MSTSLTFNPIFIKGFRSDRELSSVFILSVTRTRETCPFVGAPRPVLEESPLLREAQALEGPTSTLDATGVHRQVKQVLLSKGYCGWAGKRRALGRPQPRPEPRLVRRSRPRTPPPVAPASGPLRRRRNKVGDPTLGRPPPLRPTGGLGGGREGPLGTESRRSETPQDSAVPLGSLAPRPTIPPATQEAGAGGRREPGAGTSSRTALNIRGPPPPRAAVPTPCGGQGRRGIGRSTPPLAALLGRRATNRLRRGSGAVRGEGARGET